MRSIIALILSWLKRIFRITGKNDDPADSPEFPAIDEPGPAGPEVVCYYGCPNSKKAQKLQLSKNIYR